MKIKDIVQESASAESTTTANVTIGVSYPNVKGKQPKKRRDGTAPNALDIKGGNLLSGGSLVKR
jgi:hypothetical protein